MALQPVLKALKSGLILDGAMGTMLMDAGLTGGRASESWVLERPDEIKKVHAAYAAAGAQVITTCTFGGNGLKLTAAGLGSSIEAVNQRAARLARDVAENRCFVAGNIGPTGQLLKPSGPLTEKAAIETYAEQAGVLARNKVDFFLLQTFFDLKEMVTAIKGARSVSELPVFATMSFQETKSGFSTIMGNRVKESMSAMLAAGADVVGANCAIDSNRMVELAKAIRGALSTPILIQPNAGNPEIIDGKVHYLEDADTFAENMCRIKALGAEAIGGCCGTTPAHIHRMSEKVRRY